ncbi:MAG: hypothetical protein GX119_10320 [Syntrophomonadaceae bacterium]|nr:hypothetical protein [Syntrophomonadaceae bacterium]
MLTRHKIIFILVLVAVNLALALGLYANNHLDNFVDAVGVVGELTSADEEKVSGEEQKYELVEEADNSYWTNNWHLFSNWLRDKVPLQHWKTSPPVTNEEVVADNIKEQIGQPVENDDFLKASLIILKKLDKDEISFLYEIGNKEKPTREELREVRNMLLNKLTPEEIDTLRAMGSKYGKQLRILDPSVPID